MSGTVTIAVTIAEALEAQAARLAEALGVSRERLFALAIERFVGAYQGEGQAARRVVRQGEIYWVAGEAQPGSEAGVRHPHVVVQDDVFNHSRIETVVMCALTSNQERASWRGNVLLEVGEANLPAHSVVEVSKVATIHKTALGEYIGALSAERVAQILAGMRFLQQSS